MKYERLVQRRVVFTVNSFAKLYNRICIKMAVKEEKYEEIKL